MPVTLEQYPNIERHRAGREALREVLINFDHFEQVDVPFTHFAEHLARETGAKIPDDYVERTRLAQIHWKGLVTTKLGHPIVLLGTEEPCISAIPLNEAISTIELASSITHNQEGLFLPSHLRLGAIDYTAKRILATTYDVLGERQLTSVNGSLSYNEKQVPWHKFHTYDHTGEYNHNLVLEDIDDNDQRNFIYRAASVITRGMCEAISERSSDIPKFNNPAGVLRIDRTSQGLQFGRSKFQEKVKDLSYTAKIYGFFAEESEGVVTFGNNLTFPNAPAWSVSVPAQLQAA